MTICQLRLKVHHMVVCYPSQLLLLLLTVVIQDSLRNLASLHRVNGREKYLTLGVPCVCVCVCVPIQCNSGIQLILLKEH